MLLVSDVSLNLNETFIYKENTTAAKLKFTVKVKLESTCVTNYAFKFFILVE